MIGLLAIYAYIGIQFIIAVAYLSHRDHTSPFTRDFWNS